MDHFQLLMKVLRETKKTDQITAKAILYQAYETTFGIHDYLQQAYRERTEVKPDRKRPLSAVALHFAEDHSSTSRLYEMFDLYMEKNVHQYTGMSWPVFLELPHDQCVFILERCAKRGIKEGRIETAAMDALQHATQKR